MSETETFEITIPVIDNEDELPEQDGDDSIVLMPPEEED